MTTPRVLRASPWTREAAVPVAAVTVGVAGVAVALAGAALHDLNLALGGSGIAAAALTLLVAGGWVSGLVCVVIAMPLPPVYSAETLRISPAAIVALAAVIGWGIRRALDSRPLALGVLPRWSALGLMIAVSLAGVFADELRPAAREVLSMAILLGFLLAATDELSLAPERTATLIRTVAIVTGISGVVAVLQALGAPPREFPLAGTGFFRANLGFAGPTELGMFMGLGLPFATHLWRLGGTRAERVAGFFCLASGVLGLAATFSRGSWLAVIGSAVVLVLARQSRFAVQIWIAALIAAVAVQVGSGGALTERFTSDAGLATIDQRVALMLVGLLIFQAHPVLGVGPGGFPTALTRFGPQVPWLWDYVGAAHNAYVHIAAEAGVIGFVALVVFVTRCLFVLVRGARDPAASRQAISVRRTAVWGFAMAAAMGLVEWIFVHGVGELIMLIAAIGFARASEEPA